MTSPTTCPDPVRLQELIDGGLPEPDQAELTGHLDSCECCQQRLETIADYHKQDVENYEAAKDAVTNTAAMVGTAVVGTAVTILTWGAE